MNKFILRLPLLTMILALASCGGNPNNSSQSFSYENPSSYVPPTVDPSDFGFEENNELAIAIEGINKDNLESLSDDELTLVTSKLFSNDMATNKVIRATLDTNLYDYDQNGFSETELDEGNYKISETNTFTRDSVRCSVSGVLQYKKDVYEDPTTSSGSEVETSSSEEVVQGDIDATGAYTLLIEEGNQTFIEKKEYDVPNLNSMERHTYSVDNYKKFLNLVDSEDFYNQMRSEYNDPTFADYDKTYGAKKNGSLVIIQQTVSKTLNYSSGNITYKLEHQITIQDGVIILLRRDYTESGDDQKIYRQNLDQRNLSIVSERE
ncbi:MAG: hypothetical protein LBM03_01545 [Erysipelotrichaceae bacterium]|jgi:hypothetical protein|nr:hypothetical protein [Erysipelotrichaceae bacterium]